MHPHFDFGEAVEKSIIERERIKQLEELAQVGQFEPGKKKGDRFLGEREATRKREGDIMSPKQEVDLLEELRDPDYGK